jgi:hypothetical protein
MKQFFLYPIPLISFCSHQPPSPLTNPAPLQLFYLTFRSFYGIFFTKEAFAPTLAFEPIIGADAFFILPIACTTSPIPIVFTVSDTPPLPPHKSILPLHFPIPFFSPSLSFFPFFIFFLYFSSDYVKIYL